jgi:hypothetical protein
MSYGSWPSSWCASSDRAGVGDEPTSTGVERTPGDTTGGVITLELAQRLHDAGLVWEPDAGDRFAVPGRDMDEDFFVVSEMTVEVHDYPTGPVIGFNGTTEWALDSLQQAEVLWLPREDQLRALLGDHFVRLEAVPGGFAVVVRDTTGTEHRHLDLDAERAYARAVLAVLESGDPSRPR